MHITGTKNKEETLGLIACAWNDLPVGDTLMITQPNDQGGKSLEKVVKVHFPNAVGESYDKARHITIIKTEHRPDIIEEWLKHTELHFVDETGFYAMPGLFGWNKIDKGSALLVKHLPPLSGVVADFGCGYGYLSHHILNDKNVGTLYALDYDLRAIGACKKNCDDPRLKAFTADCTQHTEIHEKLDYVITNPPFHDHDGEDRQIGQKFIVTAVHHLKKGGMLWLVANTHMPYEKTLEQEFSVVDKVMEQDGFKIFRAVK